MTERKIGNGKYTATEIMHRYYPYKDSDMDFWLEAPKQILASLRSFSGMIEQDPKELYYIQEEN